MFSVATIKALQVYGIAIALSMLIAVLIKVMVVLTDDDFADLPSRTSKEIGVTKFVPADQIELPWEQVQYPEELEHYEVLRDGTEIFFRPVRPTDEPSMAEMLYSLSKESVRTRYFTYSMAFPHKAVQKLTNIDYRNDLAIVGVVPSPAGEEIVAIAQYYLDPNTQAAEVAFLVQDEWQAKGMGTFLLQYIATIAKQRGVQKFYATVLPINRPMLNIFHNSGYKVNTEFDGETYSVTFDLTGGQ